MSEKTEWLFRLRHILEAIAEIEEFVLPLGYEEFSNNIPALRTAERNLEIMGEAANKIPAAVKDENPTIPWRALVTMRNVVIHDYNSVNYRIIWDTLEKDVPDLKEALLDIQGKYGEPLVLKGSENDWDKAKKEAKDILIRTLKESRNFDNIKTICYSDLAKQILARTIEPYGSDMSRLLEEVCIEGEKCSGVLLTVVVVHKNGDKMPGDGFFRLAEKIRCDVKDKLSRWNDELRCAYDCYGQNKT